MCVPGGGIVPCASIIAMPPACGWPDGTASTTTGLGGGATGVAVGPGVGCGGAGSANATPAVMRTARPLLTASQRRSLGFGAAESGFAALGNRSQAPLKSGACPNAAQRKDARPPATNVG